MASATDDPHLTPARFAALLEAYGSDLERWPAATRAAARAHLAADPAAARALAEARTFDGVLALAPGSRLAPQLLDRIVAAARVGTPPSGISSRPASAVVQPLQHRPAKQARRRAASTREPAWRLGSRQIGTNGGVLAASLLIGIWLGASGAATSALAPNWSGRGPTTTEAMGEILYSALQLEPTDGTDEDTL